MTTPKLAKIPGIAQATASCVPTLASIVLNIGVREW